MPRKIFKDYGTDLGQLAFAIYIISTQGWKVWWVVILVYLFSTLVNTAIGWPEVKRKFQRRKGFVADELKIGAQVKTHKNIRKISSLGVIPSVLLNARQPSKIGIISDQAPGYEKEMCVVKHPDGTKGVYLFLELTPV